MFMEQVQRLHAFRQTESAWTALLQLLINDHRIGYIVQSSQQKEVIQMDFIDEMITALIALFIQIVLILLFGRFCKWRRH
jgi:hypothetical protein